MVVEAVGLDDTCSYHIGRAGHGKRNSVRAGQSHKDFVTDVSQTPSPPPGAERATIPLGRYGTVAEYASAAVFLMSERASYIKAV